MFRIRTGKPEETKMAPEQDKRRKFMFYKAVNTPRDFKPQ
jgi:hypothetical protein